MSAVYFLIPGARLPKAVIPSVSPTLDRRVFDELTRGADPVQVQQLVQRPILEGAVHLVWLQQVIGKLGGMPQTAAFEWEADGGPSMSTETWRLWAYHFEVDDHGCRTVALTHKLTQDERNRLHDDLLALVRRFNFQLQQWEGRWYLTRKDDWECQARPWCAQNHQYYNEGCYWGEEFETMRTAIAEFLKDHPVNLDRQAAGHETIDGLWPEGGSRRFLLKASTLRAVMSNDSFVHGWAQNAGLLNFRTTRVMDAWPEAPEGDLLCVIDDLYEPYRKGDWDAWAKAWPVAWERIQKLTAEAKSRRCQKLVLIGTGSVDTHTTGIEFKKTSGLFARFSKAKPLSLEEFLNE